MASLTITVDEVKRAMTLWAGAGGLPTEGMRHGHFVESIGIESPFV